MASKFTHTVVGGIQFFMGYWPEGFKFFHGFDQRQPSCSCHVGLSTGQLATWQLVSSEQARKKSQRERANKMVVAVFYNLITEVTLHHILYIRNKSLGSAHAQGEGVT